MSPSPLTCPVSAHLLTSGMSGLPLTTTISALTSLTSTGSALTHLTSAASALTHLSSASSALLLLLLPQHSLLLPQHQPLMQWLHVQSPHTT